VQKIVARLLESSPQKNVSFSAELIEAKNEGEFYNISAKIWCSIHEGNYGIQSQTLSPYPNIFEKA